MKLSAITPTYGRQGLLPGLVRIFEAQTYPDKELLILDDSPQPCAAMQSLSKERPSIRYQHDAQRMSLGAKRNRLVSEATGEIIVHFDDDEYYAPDYLSVVETELRSCDFFTLSAWYLYSVKDRFFGYWDTRVALHHHYAVSPNAELSVQSGGFLDDPGFLSNVWGFGFSYAYRKDVFASARFSDMGFGEDYDFVRKLHQAQMRLRALPDTTGLVLHMIHQQNMSRVFPQYRLPEFHLREIFGDAPSELFPALSVAVQA